MPASHFIVPILKEQELVKKNFSTVILLSDSQSAVSELELEAKQRLPLARIVIQVPEQELSAHEETVANGDTSK